MIPSARAPSIDTPQSCQRAAIAVMLASSVIVYLLYTLGLPGDFMFDDLIRLPSIDPTSFEVRALVSETLENTHGMLGRPLSVFSFALTKVTSGPSPEAFKYQNILLHILTGLVQFWALSYLLGFLLHDNEKASESAPRWLPAAGITTVWLLHPLFVSTILYSVQRSAILATLFVWAGILFYLLGRHALSRDKPLFAALHLIVGVPACALLGLASKENAALLPVMLLLITIFTRERSAHAPVTRYVGRVANVLLIAVPLLLGFVYLSTHIETLLSGYEFRPFSLAERVLTQSYLIYWYASLIFIPLLRRMTLYHDNSWVVTPDNIPVYIALAALIGMTVIAFHLRRRAPLVGFGLLFYLASHLLESTILPLELVFEHRNYLGASGLFLSTYGLFSELPRKYRATPSMWTIIVLLACLVLAPLLGIRTWTWSDDRKVVMMALREHPKSMRAHTEAANVVLKENRPVVAAHLLRKAARLAPNDAGPSIQLFALKCVGRLAPRYERSAEFAARNKQITPYAADSLQRLGLLALTDRCPGLHPGDVIPLLSASLTNPRFRPLHRYHISLSTAELLAADGRHEEALRYVHDATELFAEIPTKHWYRAIAVGRDISIHSTNQRHFLETLDHFRTLMTRHPLYFQYAHPDIMQTLHDPESN